MKKSVKIERTEKEERKGMEMRDREREGEREKNDKTLTSINKLNPQFININN